MPEIVLPDDTKVINPKDPADVQSGHWYWGVACHMCNVMIAVFDDEPHGSSGPVVGSARAAVGCTACDSFPTLYSSTEFTTFRAA